MQNPAQARGGYLSGLFVVVAALVVLVASLLVAERRADSSGAGFDLHGRNNPRLAQALGELIQDARGLATGRGVYTEVGSRERIDILEQSASKRQGDWRPGALFSSMGLSVCAVDEDCHYPRGVCDVSARSCRCVVAFAGVRCDRVVHVGFPNSGVYGKMLPLDVLDESEREMYVVWEEEDEEGEGEDVDVLYSVEHVEERCVVVPGSDEAAAVRERGVGQEIERRLVERFLAREVQDTGNENEIRQNEDALGDVVVLLEAMRRCLDVEVEAHTSRRRAGHPGGREAIRWLIARLEDV
jgi:hypothetical protein